MRFRMKSNREAKRYIEKEKKTGRQEIFMERMHQRACYRKRTERVWRVRQRQKQDNKEEKERVKEMVDRMRWRSSKSEIEEIILKQTKTLGHGITFACFSPSSLPTKRITIETVRTLSQTILFTLFLQIHGNGNLMHNNDVCYWLYIAEKKRKKITFGKLRIASISQVYRI